MTDARTTEERLRAALDAAATSDPVGDGWEAIHERLTGATTGPPHRLRRPPRSRLMAAAAVIALMLVAAGALAIRAGDDRPTTVVTTPSPSTGWYVPVDLPPGWRVRRVGYLTMPVCATRGVRWVHEGRPATVHIVHQDCSDGAPGDDLRDAGGEANPVDLGRGITGEQTSTLVPDAPEAAARRTLRWATPEGIWVVQGLQVTATEMAAIGRAAIADPSLASPPLAGFTRFDAWEHPSYEGAPRVEVDLTTPGGEMVSYVLTLPGLGAGREPNAYPRALTLPSQERAVVQLVSLDGSWVSRRYAADWPYADVTLTYNPLVRSNDPSSLPGSPEFEAALPDDDLRALLAALRPVTTTRWRAFLASAVTFDPALARATDLAGLTQPPR